MPDTSSPQPPSWVRSMLYWELAIVLALSLGRSAVYAVVALIARLSDSQPLASQRASLNTTIAARPALDLIYQLLAIGFALVPLALVIFLLVREAGGKARPLHRALTTLGFHTSGPLGNTLAGIGLAALIGIPGLGFYLLGRQLGITVHVSAADLGSYWWTIPVLILAAIKNALIEEVIAVSYLAERLNQLGYQPRVRIAASALLRGSYHLYQGFGAGIGNVVMGVIFAGYYQRTGRIWPLIIAHSLIDVVAFVGYAYASDALLALL
ncbi:MAG: type II CAAX endopeptidase family protein [Bowdeniella nasicola]|nr:type II CAAX endopeptidase family protein [Bowdeniella nasicola]